MPPKGDPFNAKTVGLIRAWIDQGADWPEDLGAKAVDRMDHWAFKKITWPTSPRFMHPIDAFVKVRLESKGLEFNPRASKRNAN